MAKKFGLSQEGAFNQLIALEVLKDEVSAPQETTNIRQRDELLSKARIKLAHLINLRFKGKPLYLQFNAFVDTLALSRVNPPFSKAELDEMIRSHFPKGIEITDNGYKIVSSEEATDKGSIEENRIIKILESDPEKRFKSIELAKILKKNQYALINNLVELARRGEITVEKMRRNPTSTSDHNSAFYNLYSAKKETPPET
jgi:hypothetical protein